MNTEKLANLLYPNAKDYKVFEKKYLKRKLPNGAEVTRFAPSPTGYLHLGGFFQALCDSFIASSTNGIFCLRIEDTDKKREVEGCIENIIDTLSYFEISYDEGVVGNKTSKGDYGPYIQSERKEIYEAFAKKLVLEGKAFPCFCEKAEDFAQTLEKRENLIEENSALEEKDICRNLSFEDIEKKILNGDKFALRLKSNGDPEKSFKFYDEIKGLREIRENAKDIVLIKSDGIPVYAFAHAIDDHLMGTTLVVRGEEWYPSLASHLELFDALGFARIKYAHTPVICKIDDDGSKRKFSKRKDPEFSMPYFIKCGYPVNAIKEYLLNLANSNFEIWRKENPDKKLEDFPFSTKKMSNSNPIFDFAKLNDISKTVISKMSAVEVYDKTLSWAKEFDKDFYEMLSKNKQYAINVFNIDRDVPKPRKDIFNFNNVKFVWNYMFNKYFENVTYEIEDLNLDNAREVIKSYISEFNFKEDKNLWFERIKNMSEKLGYAINNKDYKINSNKYKGTVATVCEYIRVALTGRKNSPDLYSIIQVLGEQETLIRLNNFIKNK